MVHEHRKLTGKHRHDDAADKTDAGEQCECHAENFIRFTLAVLCIRHADKARNATGVPEDAKTLKNTKMSYAVLKCPMPSSSRKFASGIEKNILMNLTINVAAVKIAVPFKKLCPFCSVF